MADEIVIPDKPAFKAAEVCELLKLQPYVLRSWENEFKDLGVSKGAGGPRVYRRQDVARAVRIRELMLREGLTLAGVRRRLEQEAVTSDAEDALIAEIASAGAPPPVKAVDRERVAQVRHGLRALLDTLSRPAPVAAATPTADAAGTKVAPAAADGAVVVDAPAVVGVLVAVDAPGDVDAAPAAAAPLAVDTAAAAPSEARPRVRRRAASGAERQAAPGPAPLVVQQPVSDVAPPAHATPARPSSPARELTVVVEEAPSLFSEDDTVAEREAEAPAQPAGKRKRPPRPPDPHAE